MPRVRISPRKLTPQEQHDLIKKYKIEIEGPIRSCDWPKRYAGIFSLVKDAEKIRYDEYYQTEVRNDPQRLLHVAQMCIRVGKLVNQAYSLRKSLDNEETWRSRTEHLILERFEAEINCHVCNDRRWLSDMEALPFSPTAAEELQRVRSSRSLCDCEEAARAKILTESTPQQFFVTKSSCTVIDTAMSEIQTKVLAHHRPDRVIGLGGTHELEDLLNANPDVKAAPIKDHTDTNFPFLVLEAKSEKNTVGFESIERQTAFPIRTMLQIQKELAAADKDQLDPLVWFLANRGDEWRLYGCVSAGSRTRIIDLWHGCILRHDSALQLLLIIDLLCDWARDVFAEQVMGCLRQFIGPNVGTASQNSVVEIVVPESSGTRRRSGRLRKLSPIESSPEPAQHSDCDSDLIIVSEQKRTVGDKAITDSDSSDAESSPSSPDGSLVSLLGGQGATTGFSPEGLDTLLEFLHNTAKLGRLQRGLEKLNARRERISRLEREIALLKGEQQESISSQDSQSASDE